MSSYEYALARNEAELASFQESPTFNDTELSKYYMGDLWQKGYGFEEIRHLVNERYNLGYSLQDINDLFDPLKTQGKNIQDYYSSYDPWDMFDHTQPMYQTNVSLRGGGERIKYYSSLGYMKQNGVSDKYSYEQVNMIFEHRRHVVERQEFEIYFQLER
ncbi:MAG: hypothetical protein ACLUVG_01090 [Phocaeicola vulgatus]